MIRATTPRHKFYFPTEAPVDIFSEIRITYAQIINGCISRRKIVLEKNISELSFDTEENSVAVNLSQREANLFVDGVAEIQVRAKSGGRVVASQIFRIKIKRVLNEEEI